MGEEIHWENPAIRSTLTRSNPELIQRLEPTEESGRQINPDSHDTGYSGSLVGHGKVLGDILPVTQSLAKQKREKITVRQRGKSALLDKRSLVPTASPLHTRCRLHCNSKLDFSHSPFLAPGRHWTGPAGFDFAIPILIPFKHRRICLEKSRTSLGENIPL